MGSRNKIDRYSIGYDFLRYGWVNRFFKAYFKRNQIINRNRIPKNEPVILAINHQNALMDAMAYVTHLKQQAVYMARADIFSSPLTIRILTFLKILPIFRMRDGVSNLQKNDEIFDIADQILRNRINPLAIFPEGNHGKYRRLRPLTKGIFRIAFKAQEQYGNKPGVKIVPCGIDYSHYQKFRSTLFLNVGEPLEVCEYWDEYEENQPAGMNKLRERLAGEMKKLMIHIQTEEYYNLYMGLRGVYNPLMRNELKIIGKSLHDQFIADKEMISRLDQLLDKHPDEIEKLNRDYRAYASIVKKLKLRDWLFSKKLRSPIIDLCLALVSMVTIPFVILGIINNWPIYFLPPLLGKKIKDSQFVSTAKWGMALAIYMIYYPMMIILSIIFIPVWWITIVYIILMPFSGLYAFFYRNFLVKARARLRFWLMKRKNDSSLSDCLQYRDKVMKKFELLKSRA